MAPMMMQQPFLGGLGVQPIYRPQYVPQPQQTMPTQVKRWEKGNNGWWYDKDGNDVLAIWNQDTNQYHLRVNGRWSAKMAPPWTGTILVGRIR